MADAYSTDTSSSSDQGSSHRPSSSLTTLLGDDEDLAALHVAPPFVPSVGPQPSYDTLGSRHDGQESPYRGPTAPSHPYQMYAQGVQGSRTASVATTSTTRFSEGLHHGPRRPVRSYDGSSGPKPQGVDVASLGPPGHKEQPPPYTRYPIADHTWVPPAVVCVAQPVPTPTQPLGLQVPQVPQPSLQVPGAGGIGLATRHPEFSTDDLPRFNSLEHRQSVRSFTSDRSTNRINTPGLPATNEKGHATGWRAIARQKVFGAVPLWAIVLCTAVLTIGGVVGAVVGVVVARNAKRLSNNQVPHNDSNPTPGFIPLDTVPPGLPPLEEGQYSLPLINPRYSNSCLRDPSQGHAWNCDAIMAQLSLTVTRQQGVPDLTAYSLDLQYNSSYTVDSYVYSYGVQPPALHNQQLQLVADVFQSGKGPAWAFATLYNKTIILPRLFLSPPTNESGEGKERRMNPYDFKRKNVAQAGDKPWICTWPATTLEVFIYPGQNATPPNYPMFGTGASTPTPSPSSASTPTGAPEGLGIKQWHGHNNHQIEEHHYTYHGPPPSVSTPSPSMSTSEGQTSRASSGPSDYFSHSPTPSPFLPQYPRQIKIGERRDRQHNVSAALKPTCRQVEIMGDGQEARPVVNDDGQPVIVEINEALAEYEKRNRYRDSSTNRRSFFERIESRDDDDSHPEGVELSDCGCIWWIT